MMSSIGARLTLWYLLILGLGFAIFAGGAWFAIQRSAREAVDAELRDRLRGLDGFMQSITAQPGEDLKAELHEHSVLGPGGDLFQVADERGNWVYRSAVLERAAVAILAPEAVTGDVFADIAVQGKPVRIATARIAVGGHWFTIQVAAPMSATFETLDRLGQTLWLLAPLLLGAAGVGGYWISRRALSPVDAITKAAESISITNLSNRLEVSPTGDELERLSETMNRMLGRLQASVERITQFTADASHELRAPVAVIRTTAELASRGERSPGELQEDMQHILAEAERTTRLIESLLMLARADSNADGLLHMEPTDLAVCARDAVEQVRGAAQARDMTVRIDEPRQPVVVYADAQVLQRMFYNLLDNGIKYNQPRGTVALTLGQEGAEAVCTVRDTGIGIAKADQAHIFDRFWRADKVRSRNSGGVGLGLAIARWIVERHRGRIAVHSVLGEGSAFEVRLPLCDAVDLTSAGLSRTE